MKVYIVCAYHPTCFIQKKSICSFIRFQIKYGDRHAFASDTIRACCFSLFFHSRLSQFPQPFLFSVSFLYFIWCACLFIFCYLQLLLLHLFILPHFVLVIQIDGQNVLYCCSSSFWFDVCDFFIVIILQSVLVLLNHMIFKVLTFEMTS